MFWIGMAVGFFAGLTFVSLLIAGLAFLSGPAWGP